MTSETLLVRDVADRLGLRTRDVYRLLATGYLDGRPDRAGDMQVTASSVEWYEGEHATPVSD